MPKAWWFLTLILLFVRCPVLLAQNLSTVNSMGLGPGSSVPTPEQYLQKVIGTSRERTLLFTPAMDRGGNRILISSEGVELPVSNSEKLELAPDGAAIPVTVSVSNGKLTVHDWSLAPLTGWQDEKRKIPLAEFEELHSAFGNLERTIDRLQKVGAMSADDQPKLSKILAVAKEQVVIAHGSDLVTPEIKEILGRKFVEVEAVEKAVYARDRADLYQPSVYRRIYENSRCSVALFFKQPEAVLGSGVLIGKDLVLTCEHNVDARRLRIRTGPKDIVVQFDYEREGASVKPTVDFEVDQIVIHGGDNPRTQSPLDFAILKLKSKLIDGKETHAGDLFPPAKLATAENLPRRNAPVYVIGHPEGNPRTVHDNAFVLFPFQADNDQFSELELAVRGEFDQEIQRLQGIERTAVEERRDAALKQLGENYLPVADGFPFRELYSVRARRAPAIAADCDTYAGNSGSGVWDRRNNVLIGILFRGEPKQVDQKGEEVALQSGWRRHELILPISEVLRQLDGELPADWRVVHGVEVGK